jgi:DNA invertase Pin-like site-specific DNA recombinase
VVEQSLDRSAEAERLYVDERLTTRAIARKLGVGPTTVGRWLDARGVARRPPGKPEKYPPVELGVCGTPGCTDPDCSIPQGECHCGCGARTPIATRHDRRRGYIKGKHERFLRAHYDRDREEYRRFHADKMTATMNELMSDARRKAKWQQARHSYPGLPANTRGFGCLGGRPAAELTDEQRRRIKLASRHWGRRKIASVFGLSERAVRNVLDS